MRSENQVLYETIAALDMDEDKVYFLAVLLPCSLPGIPGRRGLLSHGIFLSCLSSYYAEARKMKTEEIKQSKRCKSHYAEAVQAGFGRCLDLLCC